MFRFLTHSLESEKERTTLLIVESPKYWQWKKDEKYFEKCFDVFDKLHVELLLGIVEPVIFLERVAVMAELAYSSRKDALDGLRDYILAVLVLLVVAFVEWRADYEEDYGQTHG